jgi:metal-dependent amidase/aminoacylase/carboxypeptidase family protein
VVLEHPEVVTRLHEDFVHAGSDVVEAFTYYAHRQKLKVIGREDILESINRQALRIAKDVADRHGCLMAGNICNTNAYEADDPKTHKAVRAMFEEQIGWAVEEGADFLIAETIDWYGEAAIALDVMKATGLPTVVTLSVHRDENMFDGMDVIVRSHASSATGRPAHGFGTCCMNIDGVKYTFGGAPAHQLTSWNGRNALEGVIHLFNNIDSVRSSIRPEARIQGVITEGGAAPNVTPDRTAADFYIRYPDEVYLAQVTEFVDNAARAAALSTGTKVKIDHYGRARDGISLSTLGEVGFEYMKKYGATGVAPEPGKPQGFEETGSVSRDIPGIGFTAQSSTAPNHTYEMDADNLKEIGHTGFAIDAQAMAALLVDFATHANYRTAVKKEFDGIKALFGEYQAALKKVYSVPAVPEPK